MEQSREYPLSIEVTLLTSKIGSVCITPASLYKPTTLHIACSDVSVLPGPGLRGVPNYTAIKGSVIGYVCGASATALVLLGGGTGVDLGRRAAGAAVVLGCGAMLVPGAAKGSRREVYLPGAFLGAVMGAGAALVTSSDRFWNFGAYMMSMSFFHCSE